MAKFKYELIDYQIRNQDLSMEDLQYLVSANLISPFTLVRRVQELTSYPLLSHPDFSQDLVKAKSKTRSPSCIRFLNHLQRLRKAARGEKVNDEETVASQIADRRKPLPAVLIKSPQEEIVGGLIKRQGRILRILIPHMGLKIGQVLEIQIFVSYKKERLTVKVRSLIEMVDRRSHHSRIIYTYEVEQIKRASS